MQKIRIHMVLHDGKLSFIEGIGQYCQSLFDNMYSQSTSAKLKKYEFCPVVHGGIAHMQKIRIHINNFGFVIKRR